LREAVKGAEAGSKRDGTNSPFCLRVVSRTEQRCERWSVR
jgi:hypothetical protein